MNLLTKDDFITFKYSDVGEMMPYERYKLYNWVKHNKVERVLEVGTGSGASTYYIAHALKETGCGSIVTCDPGRSPQTNLLEDYPNIKYTSADSDSVIDEIIKRGAVVDFIFFDGPEIEELALNNLRKLEPYIQPGCLFSMHDWEYTPRNLDNAISIKAKLVRPYIETSSKWEVVEVLSGLTVNADYYVYRDKNCDSVGLCLYRFLG